MCPAKVDDGLNHGFIIPIGGGEKKVRTSAILNRFVELCGGQNASIAVIPTASRLTDTGDQYYDVFKDIGAGHVDVITLDERKDCDDPKTLEKLENVTGYS